jgi:hypothetical protein
MILISPGIWLFLSRVWGSMGFANSAAMWFSFGFAAIVNGVLYALVGAAIVGLRRKPKSQ